RRGTRRAARCSTPRRRAARAARAPRPMGARESRRAGRGTTRRSARGWRAERSTAWACSSGGVGTRRGANATARAWKNGVERRARSLVPCAAPAGPLPHPPRNRTMHRIGNSRGFARGLLALALLALVAAAFVLLRPDAAAQPGGGPAEEAPQGKEPPPGPGGKEEHGGDIVFQGISKTQKYSVLYSHEKHLSAG